MTKDPYRYFRIEAQELIEGLDRGLLELEREHDPEALRRLLRLAHTLKGASRVVKQVEIGDLAHGIEDVLSPLRDSGQPADRASIERALSLLDGIRERVDLLGTPAPRVELPHDEAETPPDPGLRNVRVPLADMDLLLESAFEAAQAARQTRGHCTRLADVRTALRRALSDTSGKTGGEKLRNIVEDALDSLDGVERDLTSSAERFTREVEEVRQLADHLRLLPAAAVTDDLQRAVRDAAAATKRVVDLVATGTDTRIDASILSSIKGALRHVVLNAVAHGIEPEAERIARGKPAQGTITLTIERQGERVAFRCADDGRGLDAEAIKRAALERRLVDPAAAESMGVTDVARLLLAGGVTTTSRVTAVAGRGVGLDVVRDTVARLRGDVRISTEAGCGTTVELFVPLSLSSLSVLVVEAGRATALLPLDAVRRTTQIRDEDLAPEGDSIVVDGAPIRLLYLTEVVEQDGSDRNATDFRACVVLDSSRGPVALGVGALRGVRHVVVQSVPELATIDPVVAAVAVSDDGAALPMLAPAPLADWSRRAGVVRPRSSDEGARPPPLLVIDDSMTSRMLEQSILESAGYEVDLAASGEEGIEKARARRYGLFIVDVEMPGMSGFDFIESARADPEINDVPTILVTSRSDPADRRRGKEAGAREYIVKGELDQRIFVEIVERLAS